MTQVSKETHPVTTKPTYLETIAAELEGRIASGDLRGYTVEQLSRAAERYRGLAAIRRGR
jgi:hypothetical protein